ncbi:hypothetical protein CMV_025408 [Castanea mollissima]|uniref:Uncharacterized protein n=1 Tax=Castanea mollissima TaxID=60419 RepID=A0A8J4QEK4_9ROSI|nr:hypothetical protein CMV_025408 [Castanea mollissima]
MGRFIENFRHNWSYHRGDPVRSILHSSLGKSAAPVTKEELGTVTQTFLHTLAAQVVGVWVVLGMQEQLANTSHPKLRVFL